MASDDQGNLSEEDRRQFLEEIRRRALEAELRRIEDDESEADADGGPPVDVPEAPVSPAEFLAPEPPPPPPQPLPGPVDERVSILRERLTIAISRGKLDRATTILNELKSLVPDDPGFDDFERQIDEARSGQVTPVAAAPQEPIAPAPRPTEPPATARTEPGKKRQAQKTIQEILELAFGHYQQEKYDKALEHIAEVLAVDPDNEEALTLQEQVEKAKTITDLIRSEEAKRKAEEGGSFPKAEPEPPVVISHDDREVWGAQTAVKVTDDGLDLAPEEKGPVAPPKPPLAVRVVTKVSAVRIPWKPILSVVGILLAGVAGYVVVDHIKNAVAPPQAALVVLTPSVEGTDGGLVFLGEGLTEDLIADLSLNAELRVTGAATAMVFRGSPMPPQRVAKSVGASHYLQWSISRLGDGFVIQAGVFDTTSTSSLWSSRYESSLREIPGTRREIARAILEALEVPVESEGDELLRRAPTSVSEAYISYLRGRETLRRFGGDSLALAQAWLVQAVRQDSTFAEASSALGWVHMLAYERADVPGPSYLIDASRSVHRALQQGWKGSEVYRTSSLIELYRGDFAKALERAEDAVRVAPSDAEAQRRLAVMLVARRQYDAAVTAAERAAQIDPGALDSWQVLANVHQFRGQYVLTELNQAAESREALGEALKAYEQSMRFARDRSEQASTLYAELLVAMKQPERAEQVLVDRVARVRDSYADYYKLGRIRQAAGRPKDEWEGDLRRAQTLIGARLRENPQDAVALAYGALVHTRLGEFKSALAANKQAQQLAPSSREVQLLSARMFALQRNTGGAQDALAAAIKGRYSLSEILDMDLYNLRAGNALISTTTRQ